MKTITKAEVLWARVCPLRCQYCAMPTTTTIQRKDWTLWEDGVDNLIRLRCGFVAVYGAEPLADFEYLPEFFQLLSDKGIPNTLITSCTVEDTDEKLEVLYQHGLRSLSVSYDGDGDKSPDRFVRLKSEKGLETLLRFKAKHPDLRDVACIMTATRLNFWSLPDVIKEFTENGIWTFFDFVHPDRGQEGTKCKNTNMTKELLFGEADIPELVKTLLRLKQMKLDGYRIHTSHQLLDTLIMSPRTLINYQWHCRETGFPGWVTVENTGEVYCCDDFHPVKRVPIFLWELYDRFEEFTALWDVYAQACPGCFWNTHFDANRIKMGLIPMGEYVHNN